MKILMHIQIGHDPSAEWIILQVIQHPIHLVHHALFVLMLHPHLIPIGLSDRTVFIRPFIPDMAVKVMDVVGLLLPYPQHLVGRAL